MTGGPPELWGDPETLLDVLARRAQARPDAPLVTFPGSPLLTVGALWTLAERTARALLGAGLRPGDAVLTCIGPGPAVVRVLAGAARAGLVEVPLAPDVPLATARAGAAAAGARLAVLGTGVLAANPGLAQLGGDLPVLTVDDGGGYAGGLPDLDELRNGGVALPPLPAPGDPALVMSTSGTTGRPKGVLLPHFAGVRHARRVSRSMAYGPDDVLLNAFPWNHVNIRHAGLLAALVSGARLVALPRFSASSFWRTCREEGVTAFNFMGAIAAILLRAAPAPGDREHRVSRAYGGPAPEELSRSFADRFGVRLVEAYACTELGDVTSNTVEDSVAGTAGPPLPEYEVRLLDDRGEPVGPAEVGRIAVRPRVPHISALGYVGADAEDTGGWVLPGDRGRWDDGGRLVFAGRHADVVRRRGENVSTWEVESVLSGLPGVAEVAAVGVPSALTEEDLLLAVVPAAGSALTVDDVAAWCRARLPRYARPRYVALLDRLPRTAGTKVRKAGLQEPAVVAAATDLEADRFPTGPLPDDPDRTPTA